VETFSIPGVGGIIEQIRGEKKYILLQERQKENAPEETGLFEIPAGKIREFENIFDCLRREILEETGLHVTEILGEKDANIININGYKVLNYNPFSCSQNLYGNYPIMVQVFICKVTGKLLAKTDEACNGRWIDLEELKLLLETKPTSFYPMHVDTLRKYIQYKF